MNETGYVQNRENACSMSVFEDIYDIVVSLITRFVHLIVYGALNTNNK